MSDSGQATTHTPLSVFQSIVTGELTPHSSLPVSTDGDTHLPLQQHPEFANVLRLFDRGRSIQSAKQMRWDQTTPRWQARLDAVPFGAALLRLHAEGATGLLRVESLQATKVLTVVEGRPIGIVSDQETELLGSYLIRRGLLSPRAAQEIRSRMEAEPGITVGAALLGVSAMSVDALIRAQAEQCRERIYEIFEWPTGDLTFVDESSVRELTDVIELSLMQIVTGGLGMVQRMSADQLCDLFGDELESDGPLALSADLSDQGFEIDGAMRRILDQISQGCTTNDVIAAGGDNNAEARAEALRALYTLAHMGVVTKAGGARLQLRTLPPRASAMATAALQKAAAQRKLNDAGGSESEATTEGGEAVPPAEVDELAEYQRIRSLMDTGKRLLNSYEPAAAAEKFEEVASAAAAPSTETMAYLAIALALSGHADKGHEWALKALTQDKNDALAHAAISRTFEMQGATDKAQLHERRARAYAQKNKAYLREIEGALGLKAKSAKRAPARPQAKAVRSDSGGSIFPWLIAVSTLLILFILSNVVKLGGQEYFYDGQDSFFFVRRGMLLITGWLGIALVTRSGPLAALRKIGWSAPAAPLVLALLWGALAGGLSPLQRVHSTFALVTALTLLHVLSEELFFRGFVTTALDKVIEDDRIVILLSAIVYGLYHATYYSFWFEAALSPRLNWMAQITLFAAIPYAALFVRTKSIVPPLVCHGAVSLVMMWRSVAAVTGP